MGTPGDYLNRFLTRKEQYILAALAAALCIGSLALLWHGRSPVNDGGDKVAAPTVIAGPADEQGESAEPAEENPADGQTEEKRVVIEEASEPALRVESGPEDQRVAVAVRGAVRRPGLYELDATQRVYDLIRRAGGAAEDAHLDDLNLAARLIDGSTLFVPRDAHSDVVDGRLIVRGRQSAARLNPPSYLRGSLPDETAPSESAEGPGVSAAQPGAESPDEGLIDLNHAGQSDLETLPGIGPVLAKSIIEFREQRPFDQVDDLQLVSGIGPKRLEAIRDLVTVTPR